MFRVISFYNVIILRTLPSKSTRPGQKFTRPDFFGFFFFCKITKVIIIFTYEVVLRNNFWKASKFFFPFFPAFTFAAVNRSWTSIHSIRMHTTCLLTVSHSIRLGREGVLPEVSAGECLPSGVCLVTDTPPVDRQTPVKTLPSQTSFPVGNKWSRVSDPLFFLNVI